MTEQTKKRPLVRDAFSYIAPVYANIDGPSLTQQSFAEETDINNIVKRYARGEHIPQAKGQPAYLDIPEVDLHKALNIATEVNQAYEKHATPEQRSEHGSNAFSWLADLASSERATGQEPTQDIQTDRVATPAGIGGTDPESPSDNTPSAE